MFTHTFWLVVAATAIGDLLLLIALGALLELVRWASREELEDCELPAVPLPQHHNSIRQVEEVPRKPLTPAQRRRRSQIAKSQPRSGGKFGPKSPRKR